MSLKTITRVIRNERGSILLLVTIGMIVLLGMGGLALDSGWAYVRKAQLSRAVDAGVLAAARTLRSGEAAAEAQAIAVAAANGVVLGTDGISYTLGFGQDALGEETVSMTAHRPVPTLLSRVLGYDELNVRSSAVAAVKPVDMVLVLDQSGSLGFEDCSGAVAGVSAWECLEDAAKTFVDQFSNSMDQLGLVSFQIRAEHRFRMGHGFKAPIKNQIEDINPVGDTNAGEGLRLALEQLQTEEVRERAVQVIVFFTDGRPTAFRQEILGQDRIMAVWQTPETGQLRGRFDSPESLAIDQVGQADDCRNFTTSQPCLGWTEPLVREQSRVIAEAWADAIRAQGIFVYTVGLGNPFADHPIKIPDLAHLKRLANEDGMVDGDQPRGRSYFAESGDQLDDVFSLLAQDLTVRLAR